MRILIAFLCMGFLGTVATMLALVQVVARIWPLLVVALGVVVLVRLRDRRARKVVAPPAARPAASAIAVRRPAPVRQAIPTHPAGWVLVPVWGDAHGDPQRHPVIDGDVISDGGS
ncbi:hypothetical protein OK015_28535 (plasmid) [Mycobacterium sp. Aquia_216]|uniref:hypothetical protein n=1 Tax=Mycobacterium sp. Aquia_216 TaxID=2991729 RepID=UPI00227D2EBF|nr:hypothetical protein [Mycobacterium sp. Aquia_216]WAJ47997.1 hypothetical protein OK015_28535 [Mycobacterium sp. Aquia_216]